MNCIKCGKEIPDGELFCRECSQQPVAPTKPAPIEQEPVQTPVPASAGNRRPKVSQETIRLNPVNEKRKTPLGLIVALILVSLVAVGSIVYIIRTNDDITRQRNQLRVAEASVSTIENKVTSLENQIAQKNELISSYDAEIAGYKTEISQLQADIRGQNSEVSQSQYNSSTLEKENQRLGEDLEKAQAAQKEAEKQLDDKVKELEALEEAQKLASEEVELLLQEKDDLIEELEKELEELRGASDMYIKKASFLDSYVVFIENDGTMYYHTFTCSKFKREDFWVFNTSYARTEGYTACPSCH